MFEWLIDKDLQIINQVDDFCINVALVSDDQLDIDLICGSEIEKDFTLQIVNRFASQQFKWTVNVGNHMFTEANPRVGVFFKSANIQKILFDEKQGFVNASGQITIRAFVAENEQIRGEKRKSEKI